MNHNVDSQLDNKQRSQGEPVPAPMRRAIVFADLVESVRLMERHEADAIDRWRRFAAMVREQLLPALGGRVVRTAGDGLLLDFERAPAAVAAAIALHDALRPFNAGHDAEDAMWLRIGVNLSAVTFDEHEVYGHGVNLAARLAQLAQPGETVVSTSVRDELVDGVHGDIEDLGPRFLKHLQEPVRAFRVRPPGSGMERPNAVPPRAEDLRPSIAVVPFVAMPADPEHDALGHAMADDIIASLSRHPAMRVLSRASTAAVRDGALALPRLRELLAATYMLSGRFYVHGQRIRLAAELCELRDGEVLWTGGAQADVDALFEGQDDLVPHLVSQVAQQVQAHELSRARSLPMSSLASYSLFLGASGLLNSLVPSDFARAQELLEHLMDRHPRQAAPHAMLSAWHIFKLVQGWAADAADESQHALARARQSLELDPQSADAHLALGVACTFTARDFDASRASYLQALQLDPHHAMAWARLSEIQRVTGEAGAAQQSAERALALSPLDPRRFMFESFAASAACDAKRYLDAVRHARASLRLHVLHAPPHRVLVGSLWLDGQHDAARVAAANYLRCIPGASVSGGVSRHVGAAAALSTFAVALRSAGVPP